MSTYHPPACSATLVCHSHKGLIWFYGFDYPGGAWEVVRFEATGNRTLGRYTDADAALGRYRRDVSGEPVGTACGRALAAIEAGAMVPA